MANVIGFLIALLLLCTISTSLQEGVANTTDYDYEEDYYDEPEPINDLDEKNLTTISAKTSKSVEREVTTNVPKTVKVKRDREELTTEKQFAKYEVTELVIDVPDPNTRRVPILTNFTVTKPLNFAGVPTNKNNSNTNLTDEGDEIINSIFAPDGPKITTKKPEEIVKGRNIRFNENKEKNSFFDDFDTKKYFDEELDDEDDEFDDFDFKVEPKTKGFRDYFHNVKKGITTGFDSVINKHKNDINHSLHKIVNGPILFLSKLHKKSSDLAKQIHNAMSRHKLHDKDDDDDYEDD